MDAIQSEHVEAFLQLLPGFVTAWIFYGFTAHPKPSLFERVVQALIFTTIIQAILSLVRQVVPSSLLVTDFALVTSLSLAVVLGFLTVAVVNGDWFHSAMRMAGLSKRTAMPSEWYVAFYRSDNYVILHLEDGRRLYGYPLQWPDNSLEGHFELMDRECCSKTTAGCRSRRPSVSACRGNGSSSSSSSAMSTTWRSSSWSTRRANPRPSSSKNRRETEMGAKEPRKPPRLRGESERPTTVYFRGENRPPKFSKPRPSPPPPPPPKKNR